MAKKRPDYRGQQPYVSAQEVKKAISLMTKVMTVFYGVSVVMFCLAWACREGVVARILCTVAGVLCFLIGCIFLISLLAARRMDFSAGEQPPFAASGERRMGNVFLDGESAEDGCTDTLTLADARNRLHGYMALFLQGGKLYLANLFTDESHVPGVFKPLFCYDFLLSLIEEDDTEKWKNVMEFGKDFADTFARYLSVAGEESIPGKIQYYIAVYAANREKTVGDFRRFIMAQKAYLEERFMQYLRSHIREFNG